MSQLRCNSIQTDKILLNFILGKQTSSVHTHNLFAIHQKYINCKTLSLVVSSQTISATHIHCTPPPCTFGAYQPNISECDCNVLSASYLVMVKMFVGLWPDLFIFALILPIFYVHVMEMPSFSMLGGGTDKFLFKNPDNL